MAFTQSDLDRINAAIASGKRSVQLNGRRIEYQSLSDMLKAKAAIEQELNAGLEESTGVNRPRGYRAKTSKGY